MVSISVQFSANCVLQIHLSTDLNMLLLIFYDLRKEIPEMEQDHFQKSAHLLDAILHLRGGLCCTILQQICIKQLKTPIIYF